MVLVSLVLICEHRDFYAPNIQAVGAGEPDRGFPLADEGSGQRHGSPKMPHTDLQNL